MILVTGGMGFLGAHVIRKISKIGNNQIRVLVRPGTKLKFYSDIFNELNPEKLDIYPISFKDRNGLKRALEGVDIVYHCAASKKGSFASMVVDNVVDSENIFQASVEAHVSRFVLVSSFSVMDFSNIRRGSIVNESVPLDHDSEWRDPYSFSKQRQELLAWEYYKKNALPLVVIRPGVIFGEGADILSPRIGIKLLWIFLHCGGLNKLPLIYVENCAEAIVNAGTVPNINGQIFCIVDDDLPTSKYLLKRYSKEISPIHSVRIPYSILKLLSKLNQWYTKYSEGHIPAVFNSYVMDTLWEKYDYSNNKAKELIGWNPPIPMKIALDRTFLYLSKHKGE